jgi:1-acyl-sn-glycerol-3-phosphate acyltransferase
MGYLRLLYRLPLLLLHIFVGTPLTVLCHYRPLSDFRFGGRRLEERTAKWWGRNLCRIFGLRLEVSGAVPPGPQLVVANHISWIDIPLLFSVAPLSFVSKAEIEQWPVIGFVAKAGNTVFHRRGSHDSAHGVAAVMKERLEEGGNVAIFPEGGILAGPGVKRFHGRLFAAAIETGVPVQPLMLRYVRNGQHEHDMTFLPGEHFVGNFFRLLRQPACKAQVAVLDRIDPRGKQRRLLANEAGNAVREAFDRELRDA